MSPPAVERDVMEYDVCIVGAGPSGLACAIRLKQLAAKTQIPTTTMSRASILFISQGTNGMMASCGRPVQASTKPICSPAFTCAAGDGRARCEPKDS